MLTLSLILGGLQRTPNANNCRYITDGFSAVGFCNAT